MQHSLSQIAECLGAKIQGEENLVISGLASLPVASATDISFMANSSYQAALSVTNAAAVIVREQDADDVPCTALIVDDPYLSYARVSQLFDNRPVPEAGIHTGAVVDDSAHLGAGVVIGPNAVVGKRVVIGEGTEVGAGTVIGDDTIIGCHGVLGPNVTIFHGVVVGDRARVLSGAVIGADGFGYAPNQGRWERIAQLGGVVIGDDVSIGANTCVDRGALGDTVIENSVILDNLIQIAHNVRVGEGTAMAGCVGIAGSTDVGKHCTLAGGVGLAGHLKLADGVHIMGMTLVTNSIDEPGVYASGIPHMPVKQWRRNVTRFKQLDSIAKRLQKLEKTQEGKA